MYLKSYKDLLVWQRSMELVEEVFLLTNKFPKSELYGIISQMRRAVISIPSQIAEGYGRQSTGSYIQFLTIAYGSSLELETQVIIAKKLKFAAQEDFLKVEVLHEEVCKMLNSLISKLKRLTKDS